MKDCVKVDIRKLFDSIIEIDSNREENMELIVEYLKEMERKYIK